jgi:hypothetical protein
METLRILSLCFILLSAQTVSFAQISLTFYGFDKDFITDRLPADSAISELTATAFHPAHTIQSISCGGEDGEPHIGIGLDEAQLSRNLMPLTAPLNSNDSHLIYSGLACITAKGPAINKGLKVGQHVTVRLLQCELAEGA